MSIHLVLLTSAVIFGAIAGSFLNALLFRYNTGRGMGGRSQCMHCGHTLGVIDLVPVFSYLFLWGKCRHCGSKISFQYPLVECIAAALSGAIYAMYPEPVLYIFWFLVWMIFLFVVVYDTRHGIIPWECSISLAFLALALLYISPFSLTLTLPSFWSLLSGPLLALPLFLISLVSWGRWMGWGDSALELSVGWFLGLSAGLTAMMLAFWSGALIGVVLIALSRVGFFGYTIKSEMPFAPFLIFGAAIAYFFHVDFFSTLTFLW